MIHSKILKYLSNYLFLIKRNNKGIDISPSGQVDKILKRRLKLLKMIRQFAEYCKYSVFEDFTCERAAIMYKSYVVPSHEEFLKIIAAQKPQPTSNEESKVEKSETPDAKTTDEMWKKYPFYDFVKEFLYSDTDNPIFGPDYNENSRRVRAYWEYIRSIFEEVQEYHKFEMIREQKEREKYVMCEFSKVVGMTASYLVINQDLHTFGLNYDTIIFENGSLLTDLEKFLALNLQDSSHLKRIIISGTVEE